MGMLMARHRYGEADEVETELTAEEVVEAVVEVLEAVVEVAHEPKEETPETEDGEDAE